MFLPASFLYFVTILVEYLHNKESNFWHRDVGAAAASNAERHTGISIYTNHLSSTLTDWVKNRDLMNDYVIIFLHFPHPIVS